MKIHDFLCFQLNKVETSSFLIIANANKLKAYI